MFKVKIINIAGIGDQFHPAADIFNLAGIKQTRTVQVPVNLLLRSFENLLADYPVSKAENTDSQDNVDRQEREQKTIFQGANFH